MSSNLIVRTNEDVYKEKVTMVESLSKAFDEITSYHFGLSLGSAIIDSDLINAKDLYNQADIEMYEYKKARNSINK